MTTDGVAAADRSGSDAVVDAARLRADDDMWDRFVAVAPMGSYPQLSAWADSNVAKGWTSRRIVTDTPNGPVGSIH